MRKIYVVTAFGLGIDTICEVFDDISSAEYKVGDIISEYHITDTEDITSSIRKGYSVSCSCEVEIQIHEREISLV